MTLKHLFQKTLTVPTNRVGQKVLAVWTSVVWMALSQVLWNWLTVRGSQHGLLDHLYSKTGAAKLQRQARRLKTITSMRTCWITQTKLLSKEKLLWMWTTTTCLALPHPYSRTEIPLIMTTQMQVKFHSQNFSWTQKKRNLVNCFSINYPVISNFQCLISTLILFF